MIKLIPLRIAALALALMYPTMQGSTPASAHGERATMAHTFSFQSAQSTKTWDPLNPPKGAGGLAGLYWGSKLQNTYTAFGGLTLNTFRYYVIFFPTGQYIAGLPTDGKLSDFTELFKMYPKRCGTYRLQGNNIIVEGLSDSNQVEQVIHPFRRIDANHISFMWNGAPMYRAEPVHDLHLKGFYTFGTQLAGYNSTANAETYLEFSPDGRYRESGFTSIIGPRVTTTAKRGPQTGRYKIDEFRLTLTPDNEPPRYFTILVENPSNAKGIFINDRAFLSQ